MAEAKRTRVAHNFQDLSGKRFGRLVVVCISERSYRSKTFWNCRCDCGSETTVFSSSLKSGATRSCGCLNIDSIRKRSRTHGMSNSPEYGAWKNMVRRCTVESEKQYKDYGGRGIKVCERWRESFENFLADMGPRPEGMTLDRIHNDGNYEPGNVRWATRKEQGRNRRTTTALTFNRETLSITEWAERLNLPRTMLESRHRKGLPVEMVLASRLPNSPLANE